MGSKETVNLIVVENAPDDLGGLVLRDDNPDYTFEWHMASQTRVDPLLKSQEKIALYNDFIDLLKGLDVKHRSWEGLKGKAIVFLDLGLEMEEFPDKYAKEVESWLGASQAAQFGNKQNQGLYLAGVALQNQNWEGILVLASSQTAQIPLESAITAFRKTSEASHGTTNIVSTVSLPWSDRLTTPKKVLVMDAGGAITGGYGQRVLDQEISAFIEQFGSLENRLWPEFTKTWFKNSRVGVPHNFGDITDMEKYKLEIKKYLHGLLSPCPGGDCIHEKWFSEEESPHLHTELKSLVGDTSHAQGLAGGYDFTLGNAALVLAAVVRNHGHKWLDEINWSSEVSHVPILPPQKQEEARQAVLSLAELFREVSFDDDKKCLVRGVGLSENALTLELDFCSSTSNSRVPLLEKLRNIRNTIRGSKTEIYSGDTFLAWVDFMSKSAKGKDGGRESRCVVNFRHKLEQDMPERTILEIVPCKLP